MLVLQPSFAAEPHAERDGTQRALDDALKQRLCEIRGGVEVE